MRRLLVCLVSIAVLGGGTAGCGGGDRPSVSPTAGRLRPTSSVVLPDPADDPGAVGSGETPGGPATTGGSGGPGGGSAGGSVPAGGGASGGANTPAAVAADPAAAAALAKYLDGMAAELYGDSMAASTGGPRMLAWVRGLLKRSNDQAGLKTTFAYTERAFAPVAASASRVQFKGKATLKGTTRPNKGPAVTTEVTFTDPVVTAAAGAWRVAEVLFQGKPVVWHEATTTGIHPRGPTTVRLYGALAYESLVAVVIGFEVKRDFAFSIRDDALVHAGRTAAEGNDRTAGPYAYFSYPRRDDRPQRWRGTFTIDDSSPQVITLNF